eukprot:Em0021g629a
MQWQSFLLRYGSYSGELREAMAVLTRRLANSVVDWGDIKALMANRLIALDKSPGVRPIGIGECIRRVIGKTMALVTGRDVQDVCGVEQLATGLKASIEGAIHAMTDLYNEFASDSWGFLLIDAVNAFNMINRTTALWNARVLWPRCSRFLFNTYRGYSMLILKDTKECIYSKEGVTQGDLLSMFFYAVAVLPLIRSLASNSNFVQCWYADDSACVGKLSQIRLWLEKLIQLGPAYGYFAEPTKSVLVVAPQFEDVAKNCFKDLGITVSSGHRFLGGVIGTREYCRNFMKQKHAISDQFFPSLLGGVVTVEEKRLFQLPTYLAGLGIYDPTETAVHAYKTSRQGTATVSEAIKGVTAFQHEQHLESLTTARKMSTKAKEDDFILKFESIIPSFSPDRQRALRRSLNGKTSTWLNVLPLQNYHFDLSPLQFRDGLAIRYLRDPPCLPPKCDGCGTALTLQHALDCKKGGLVIQRHNEIRDCIGDIASQVWTHVIKEPVVREADVKNADGGLRLDLGIRGVWQPQVEALFDVKVVDTDAPSHRTRSPEAILESGAKEKKMVYEQAVVERRGNFTPI